MKIQVLAMTGVLMLAGCGSSTVTEGSGSAAAPASVAQRTAGDSGTQVSLHAGWNLVGFQASQLESLQGASALTWWDGSSFQTMEARPEAVDTSRAYWVYAQNEGSLSYSGPVSASQVVALTPGWNLVSFTHAASAAQLKVPSEVLPVFSEGAGTGRADLQAAGGSVKAGTGYWVYSSAAASLTRSETSGSRLRFSDVPANWLRGRPLSVQVEALRPDGSRDTASIANVTLSPGGQVQPLSGSTALFPGLVFTEAGTVRLVARASGSEEATVEINIVDAPPAPPQ